MSTSIRSRTGPSDNMSSNSLELLAGELLVEVAGVELSSPSAATVDASVGVLELERSAVDRTFDDQHGRSRRDGATRRR